MRKYKKHFLYILRNVFKITLCFESILSSPPLFSLPPFPFLYKIKLKLCYLSGKWRRRRRRRRIIESEMNSISVAVSKVKNFFYWIWGMNSLLLSVVVKWKEILLNQRSGTQYHNILYNVNPTITIPSEVKWSEEKKIWIWEWTQYCYP
jgi:hypothetical protein